MILHRLGNFDKARASKTILAAVLIFWSLIGCAREESLWIDVRTADEYATGHVEGAVNIPYESVSGKIDQLVTGKDATVYLYCGSGRRADITKAELEEAGYTGVVNLGGLEDAQRAAAADKP